METSACGSVWFPVETAHSCITHLAPRLERAPFWPEEHILEVQLDVILYTRHFRKEEAAAGLTG